MGTYEILHNDNATSKLTIAKDRVTIKIGRADTALEDRIIALSTKVIKALSPVENTYRGQFIVHEGRIVIKLYRFTVNKEYTKTFEEFE